MASNQPETTPRDDDQGIETYGFFLYPEFAMMSSTSAVEPLRAANRLSGRRLYDWKIVSLDGLPIPSSSGIEVVPHASIDEVERIETLMVVAGLAAQNIAEKPLLGWLRKLARRGTTLGRPFDRQLHSRAGRAAGRVPLHDPLGEPGGIPRAVSRFERHRRAVRD